MSDNAEAPWPGLIGALFFDVQDALSRQESHDTPTNRRGLVRTFIAGVEGLAWMYREHVLEIAEAMEVLDDSDRQALSESSFSVTEDGRVSEQRRFLSTVAMVRLITRIAMKYAPGMQPDFGVEGWVNLKQTIALRNRITHPKADADLEISTDEIVRAKSAFFWFADLVMGVMDQTTEIFRSFTGRMGEVLRLLEAGDEQALELYRRLQQQE